MNTFTKVPNYLLDNSSQLSHGEFRVLMYLCRQTEGYHRKWCEVSYSKITEKTSIKKLSSIMKSLKKKDFIDFKYKNGHKSQFRLISPMTSSQCTNDLRSMDQLPQVNGLRGAKESIKENNKEKDFLFNKFISVYPNIRINNENQTFTQWNKLNSEEKKLCLTVITKHVSKWNQESFKSKYIPFSYNY